jgi:EpsI family protein
VVRFLATAGLLAITIALSVWSRVSTPLPLAMPLSSIPETWRGFQASEERLPEADAAMLRPTVYLARVYRRRESTLGLLVAYFDHQEIGKSIHSPKTCLPQGGWDVVESSVLTVPVESSRAPINLYRIQRGDQSPAVYYWYQSRSAIFASEYQGKLALALDHVMHRRSAAAIVRVTVPEGVAAREDTLAFIAWIIPEVWRCLGHQAG